MKGEMLNLEGRQDSTGALKGRTGRPPSPACHFQKGAVEDACGSGMDGSGSAVHCCTFA